MPTAILSPAVILSELVREVGLYLSGRALRAVQAKAALLKQGVTLPRGCTGLCCIVWVGFGPAGQQAEHALKRPPLTQSWAKSDQGAGQAPPEYWVLLEWGNCASMGLETNVAGQFVATKTSEYAYYC